MKSTLLVIAFLAIVYSHPTFACSPVRLSIMAFNNMQPKVIASPNGQYLLKLIPSQWATEKGQLVKKRESYGIAFEVTKSGQLKQLWSYKNWNENTVGFNPYSYPELYLSNNGRKLTQINREVSSVKDKRAVILYHNGKKSADFSAADFGVEKVRLTSCGTDDWTYYNPSNPNGLNFNYPIDAIDGVGIKTVTGKEWFIDPYKQSLNANK